MTAATLAIDFGTSNSAAAILDAGRVRRIEVEAGADTLPTAVFFPSDGGAMRIGQAAAEALVGGEDGRYMRALKSVLGTALLHEPRLIGGRRRSLSDIVTAFLADLKARAEAATGRRFARVLSGRPVHFHPDPDRDRQALDDLRACYHAAGFEDVDFLFEPEAAALACPGEGRAGEVGLIVDIGGGTSDFTVFRGTGAGPQVVASHGIRLGGTDFDHALSMSHAMPLLGLGGALTREFGAGQLPVPNAIFVDLSTWAKIPFLYTRETERGVADMLRHAVEPAKIGRLATVLRDHLGHDIAFAVERGKIDANRGGGARINMGMLEPGLSAAIGPGSMAAALSGYREDLRHAILQVLALAAVRPDAVETIVCVGGSSLMSLVTDEVRAVCPAARLRRSEAFTAVVDGLALATAR